MYHILSLTHSRFQKIIFGFQKELICVSDQFFDFIHFSNPIEIICDGIKNLRILKLL